MPRTPDRFPGTREEEQLVLIPGATQPSTNGAITYVSGVGFRFYEGGVVKTLSSGHPTSCVGGYADNFTTTWMVIGAVTITWSDQAVWVFRAHIAAPTGFTAEIRLFDQAAAAEVTDTLLSTTSTIPAVEVSPTLAVGTGVKTYLVQLRIASGSPTTEHRAVCYYADVIVT